MVATQRRHLLNEGHSRPVHSLPVVPGGLVVLAVGVVVPVLGSAQLIASQNHRHSLGEKKGGEHALRSPFAQRPDPGIVSGALDTRVPRTVVRVAVVIVLAVGLVVLVVVRHQVNRGEPIMGGDEVDRGEWTPRPEDIRAGGESGGNGVDQTTGPPPEVTEVVAIAAVPFRPCRRKPPELICARPYVPRLSDELHVPEGGVLLHCQKERGIGVELFGRTTERGGEIESKPVDMHLLNPIAEAVHDQPQRPW